MKWSEQAWLEIKPIYNSILKMPFIQEMMEGNLPLEKFQFYMDQDSAYLEQFGRALALIGVKSSDIQDALAFIRFGEEAIVVENALHQSYFIDFKITATHQMEPACHHYVHYIKSTVALDPVEVGMAVVLPCFWIYKRVGDYILAHQNKDNNPYQKWIDTYAGVEFGESVQRAIDIVDRVASLTTASMRHKMTEAFIRASQMEFDFWDGAYELRKWNTFNT